MSGDDRMAPRAEAQRQKQPGTERDERNGVEPADKITHQPPRSAATNHVESDEIFMARRAEARRIVPAEVEAQYVRVGNKYHARSNPAPVAFEDKGNKLETRAENAHVAETLVRIALARGWDEIKVSGSERFRREVWLEAAARGMDVKGYMPTEQDKAEIARRSRAAEGDPPEPDRKGLAALRESSPRDRAQAFAQERPADAVRQYPELTGTYAAVASMQKKAEADNLTPQQRAVVMARVRRNVVNSIERGETPEVKLRHEVETQRRRTQEREAG